MAILEKIDLALEIVTFISSLGPVLDHRHLESGPDRLFPGHRGAMDTLCHPLDSRAMLAGLSQLQGNVPWHLQLQLPQCLQTGMSSRCPIQIRGPSQ